MNIKIRRKIYLLLIFTTVLLIGTGIIGFKEMKSANDRFKYVYSEHIVAMADLKKLSDLYAVDIVDTSHKVQAGNVTWEDGIKIIDETLQTSGKTWDRIKVRNNQQEEIRLQAEIENLLTTANKATTELSDIFSKKDKDALRIFRETILYIVIDPLTQKIEELSYLQVTQSKEEYEKSEALYSKSRNILITGMVLMLFLSVFGVRSIVGVIIKNVQAIKQRELDFQTAYANVTEALLSNNMDIENISITVHKEAMRLTNSAHGYVAELDTETMDLVAHSLTEMMKDGQCNVDTTHKRMTFPKGQDSYNALWGHALNTKNGFYVNNPKEHPAYKGCIPEGHAQIKRYLSVPSVIGGRLIGQIAVANAERDYTDDDLNVIERLAMIYALAVERKRIEEKLKYFNEHLQSMVTTEVEKRRLQEQLLIQQSKMASMGEMISLIAHQWKQPLNAVTLNVQDFRDAYKQGELDDKYIDNIVGSTMQQIDFMAKTIDDFRNFFIPSKKKIRFDVKAAIDELLSMFMHVYIRHNVDVSLKSEQYVLLNVEGYPNEFKQVILNILNNAKEAIVSRKKIEPQIKGDILINICNTEDKSKVIVSIKDNGGGISNDVITKIFEPYFTTKDKEGTGIGKRQVNPIFKKISRGVILV